MIIGAFDCETIPAQNIPEDCKELSVKLGRLTDPAKIAAKKAEAEEKMSVQPDLCQVTTFCGFKYDTQERKVTERVSTQWPPAESEYDGIYAAWQFINTCYNGRIPLVSFNGVGFDLPVLQFRAMVNDVPVDHTMYEQLTKKWGTKHHYDLMLILSGYNPQRWRKFDFYMKLFGLGEKPESMDGSQVYPTWLAGEYVKIRKYCESDTYNLCLLFQRIEHWIVIK